MLGGRRDWTSHFFSQLFCSRVSLFSSRIFSLSLARVSPPSIFNSGSPPPPRATCPFPSSVIFLPSTFIFLVVVSLLLMHYGSNATLFYPGRAQLFSLFRLFFFSNRNSYEFLLLLRVASTTTVWRVLLPNTHMCKLSLSYPREQVCVVGGG